MNDFTREIFANKEKLREKLATFLKTNDSVKIEIYAVAAEKFFNAGERQKLKWCWTWSWSAMFFCSLIYFYRRLYLLGFVFFILGSIPFFNWLVWAVLCGNFKWFVIRRFAQELDKGIESFENYKPKSWFAPIFMGSLNAVVCFVLALLVLIADFGINRQNGEKLLNEIRLTKLELFSYVKEHGKLPNDLRKATKAPLEKIADEYYLKVGENICAKLDKSDPYFGFIQINFKDRRCNEAFGYVLRADRAVRQGIEDANKILNKELK